MSNPLAKLRRTFGSWLEIPKEDMLLIDFAVSVVLSIHPKVNPVWGYFIGPSGSMKSEVLRTLDLPITYYLDRLTPASIVSGYRGGGKDPSILPDWDGKVTVIKDFSSIVNLPRDQREAIFSALRSSYDGEYVEAFGNIGRVAYKSTYGMLVGTTSIVDVLKRLHQVLGERFVSMRIRKPLRKKAVRKAISNLAHVKVMRKKLKGGMKRFYKEVRALPWTYNDIRVPLKIEDMLVDLADLVALCRSQVFRIGYARDEVPYTPEPEVGTRLGQQFRHLIISHAWASGRREVSFTDFKLVLRAGLDSIPTKTAIVLEKMFWDAESREVLRTSETSSYADEKTLSKIVVLPKRALHSLLEDMWMLGILDRKKGKWMTDRWRLKPHIFRQMDILGIWVESYLPKYLKLKVKGRK